MNPWIGKPEPAVMKIVPIVLLAALAGGGIVYGKIQLFHVLGLLVLPFVIYEALRTPALWRNGFLIFLMATLGWYAVSLSWTENRTFGGKYVFYLLNGVYVAFLSALYAYRSSLRRLERAVHWFYVTILVIGVLETYRLFRWPLQRYSAWNSMFGVDVQYEVYFKEFQKYASETPEVAFSLLRQPAVFFWEPNRLSVVLVLLTPLVCLTTKRNWVAGLFLGLTGHLLIIGGSRAAMVGYILMIPLLWAARRALCTDERAAGIKPFLVAFLVLAMHSPMYGVFQGKASSESIEKLTSTVGAVVSYAGTGERVDSSVGKRRDLAIDALRSFQARKWLGLGAGNSQQKSKAFFGTTYVHNFWLEILCEAGILYALAFSLFVGLLGWRLLQERKGQVIPKNWRFGLFISLLGFGPACLAVGTPVYLMSFWFVLGLSCVAAGGRGEKAIR